MLFTLIMSNTCAIHEGHERSFVCAANLTDNSTTAATELFDGLITITDPQLFSDGSAKIRNTAVGAAVSATGLNYSPCLVVSGPAGLSLCPTVLCAPLPV